MNGTEVLKRSEATPIYDLDILRCDLTFRGGNSRDAFETWTRPIRDPGRAMPMTHFLVPWKIYI